MPKEIQYCPKCGAAIAMPQKYICEWCDTQEEVTDSIISSPEGWLFLRDGYYEMYFCKADCLCLFIKWLDSLPRFAERAYRYKYCIQIEPVFKNGKPIDFLARGYLRGNTKPQEIDKEFIEEAEFKGLETVEEVFYPELLGIEEALKRIKREYGLLPPKQEEEKARHRKSARASYHRRKGLKSPFS